MCGENMTKCSKCYVESDNDDHMHGFNRTKKLSCVKAWKKAFFLLVCFLSLLCVIIS